jgi:hypothetical protein
LGEKFQYEKITQSKWEEVQRTMGKLLKYEKIPQLRMNGKDWVNIWNDKKTPNAGENVIVMRCHSHYAALHAHVALARYTSSPKISRL